MSAPVPPGRTDLLTEDPGARRLTHPLRVAAIRGNRAVLTVERAAGCGACALKSGCSAHALGTMVETSSASLELASPGAVCPGDLVDVSMSANTFLKAASLAFLLPPSALVATLMLAAGLSAPPALTAVGALLAFALAFLPLRRMELSGILARELRIEGRSADAEPRP